MSLRIAVVDDDKDQIRYLSGLVDEWARERGEAADIRGYGSAGAFLFDYEDSPCDLLLLDIEMEGINGMELARKLRGRGDKLPIVFITGYADYMNEGYDVEALHYLLKPLDCGKLKRVLDRYADRRPKVYGEILAETEKGSIHISVSDIMFIEAFGRDSGLYLRDGRCIECREGIGALRERLCVSGEGPAGVRKETCPESFVCCHRSYLLNLRYVRSVGRSAAVLDDGREIPVSRRAYADVSRAFTRYYTAGKEALE